MNEYRRQDHLFRACDPYAAAKYDLTHQWLSARARPGMRLLHVGCGSGEYHSRAASLGLEILACEPDPEARAMAQAGCRILPCGLEDLPGQVEPAEFLVMHDVLEHIEDDRAAVKIIHELLKPRGVALLSVPALPLLFGFHDEQLGHYRRYTRRTLLKLFSDGFRVRRARYFGFAFIPVAFWYSRIRRVSYPKVGGTDSRALQAVCAFERRIPFPIGTSLLIEVERYER